MQLSVKCWQLISANTRRLFLQNETWTGCEAARLWYRTYVQRTKTKSCRIYRINISLEFNKLILWEPKGLVSPYTTCSVFLIWMWVCFLTFRNKWMFVFEHGSFSAEEHLQLLLMSMMMWMSYAARMCSHILMGHIWFYRYVKVCLQWSIRRSEGGSSSTWCRSDPNSAAFSAVVLATAGGGAWFLAGVTMPSGQALTVGPGPSA